MVDLNKKDWTVDDDLAYIAELRKEKMPEYPKDSEGKEFENKSGKKKRLKRTAKKGNRVAQAIRSWGSTQEFCVNNPAYEPLDEDFWREYCNLLRN